MIKKLDRLILKAFFWPFMGTFFITLFVLLMQIIWKYIDDLVGKGLDFYTIFKFVIFASATLVTLALPIAILLSSIMTFGQLGESYELVAIKSAGISLVRFMRPLFFVAILLSGITFLFANYVIPVANLKFEVLWSDIYRKSPAFDLRDGVFYNGLQGYSIKVGKKGKDKVTLNSVIIYEKAGGPQDHCIISEKGYMSMSPDKKYLQFRLINGNRYEESGDVADPSNNEFIQVNFKEYNKLFDLSQLDIQFTADSLFRKGYKMLNVRQLDKAIDSLEKLPKQTATSIHHEFENTLGFFKFKDSVATDKAPKVTNFDDLVPDSLSSSVMQRSDRSLMSLVNVMQVSGTEYATQSKDVRLHLMEWHRKFSLSLACMVLLFIGAPLGAIIRKGGLGMPLIVAIIFFVVFHLLNTFGEKFVKEGVMTPLMGMWLSILVLTPLGIFLTYKAAVDSQLFNKEFYYRITRPLRPLIQPLIKRFSKKESES